MPTGTRHVVVDGSPYPISVRGMKDPKMIELTIDAMMVETAARMGRDKCVKVGCMTLIVPANNRDGFCQWHRRTRRSGGSGDRSALPDAQ